MWALRMDPLGFLTRMARQGDAVRFRFGKQQCVLLSDPELIREVLVAKDACFIKGRGLEVAKRFLGEGLLTSEGAFHRRQRRLAAPAFHRQRIAAYGATMAQLTEERQQGWRDGAQVDIAEEMRRLTMSIAAQTLFGARVDSDAPTIGSAIAEVIHLHNWAMMPLADRLEPLFFPLRRRFERAKSRLDAAIYRMIAERRRSGEDRGDLLSMLLLAQDEEGGGRMTDLQLRDEAMTLFLAGHETTANALAWTWYLLTQHPDAEAALHRELDAVLAGRAPTAEDLPDLPYTRMVLSEAMRLYPPAWLITRRAVQQVEIGEHAITPGTAVFMSQWVVHHDERYYPEPLEFRPERWKPEAQENRPNFAYFPFGGGSRICIGEPFAWMEGILVLASMARSWRMRLVPGQRVRPQPLITLRPRPGIRVTLELRS